jgi:UTP--glucose-1-phosphate uridylyltransferase
LPDLRQTLDQLDAAERAELERHGVDARLLSEWAERLAEGDTENRVSGRVEAPAPGDIADLPEPGSAEADRLAELGLAAMRRGELAVVVLAGGMATRMGGVVKALLEAFDDVTFLDARLAERRHWAEAAGARLPLWLMTSYATDEAVREALLGRRDAEDVAVVRQRTSVRLTPEGELFREDDGTLSLHATGHGDLPDALHDGGLLDDFVQRGGRVLWIANLDNLGAVVDPLVLGWHLDHPEPLTVEVVDKQPGDRGGIPVRYEGRPIVLEGFRLPEGFEDAGSVFNTNTFLADAEAIRDLEMDWTYFRVEKVVADRTAIQFERLIGQLPEALPARFVRVPRSGPGARFLPAKDHEELERNREAIRARIAPFLR